MPPKKRKRGDKPPRDDAAVKVDRNLLDKAKFVATRKHLTVAEYVSELLRTPIERDFAKAVKDAMKDKDPEA